MTSVEKIFQDYAVLIPTLVIVSITAMVAFQFIWNLFEDILVNKLGIQTKWGRKKREEHDLLLSTVNAVKELSQLREEDVKKFIEDDKKIREELRDYVTEIKQSVEENKNTIQVYSENRIADREKSREIQTEINKSINELTQGANERQQQIEALMCGSMELLGDKIDQRFSKYVAMKGIPENEVVEFDALFFAYKNLNGNHGREQKYKYVKNHLSVLPIEINPIYDAEKEDV